MATIGNINPTFSDKPTWRQHGAKLVRPNLLHVCMWMPAKTQCGHDDLSPEWPRMALLPCQPGSFSQLGQLGQLNYIYIINHGIISWANQLGQIMGYRYRYIYIYIHIYLSHDIPHYINISVDKSRHRARHLRLGHWHCLGLTGLTPHHLCKGVSSHLLQLTGLRWTWFMYTIYTCINELYVRMCICMCMCMYV